MSYIIEIATTDFSTTASAVKGGADRIELCAGLSEGGITPSYGTIRQCRESFGVAIFPIIRPRPGDFFYSDEEFAIVESDIEVCKSLRCDGVVIGMLRKDGTIDVERIKKLVQLAFPMEVTFHRAFDRCANPFAAMEQLIEAGVQRILTSGQQPGAMEGAPLIANLVQQAAERITIMPGSGVRIDNVRELANKTGATEFHTSLRTRVKSSMDFMHPSFSQSEESYMNPAIDPASVRALRLALED